MGVRDMGAVVDETMILVFTIHLSSMVAGFLRSTIMGMAGERVVARLRLSLFRAILHQEVGFFDSRKTGELVSRLGSDTTIVQLATTRSALS